MTALSAAEFSATGTPARGDRRFDVVIVGGRIAGCAMAIHLARAGLSVAVVERDAVPTDTLSTHYVQDFSLFEELGVLGGMLDSGAPPLLSVRLDLDGVDLSTAHPGRPRMCLRRLTLDALLWSAARDAGATMLRRTSVVGVLRAGGRVTGVSLHAADGSCRELRARLVVGADGRNSTVARLVGARRYDVVPNQRASYWRYYAGVPMPSALHLTRMGRDLILAAPCDAGLTLVAAQPPLEDDRDWRMRATLETVASELIGPLRGILQHAAPVGETRCVRRMDGFFREATGPGWVLVGDAGHFKDVVVGQGICDAVRQARDLARRVARGLQDGGLDPSLQAWWRERDGDARPRSWFAQDLGRVDSSVLDQQVLRVVSGSARRRRDLQQVLDHRRPPRHVTGVSVGSRALARALVRTESSRHEVAVAASDALRREYTRRTTARPPVEPSSLAA